MSKPAGVLWLPVPEPHDYAAAQEYLSLLMPGHAAERYARVLRAGRKNLVRRKAKDILRASRLPLLPEDNKHVARDLARIRAGEHLSPVLLVRGHWDRPLLIADGYHRVCACEHHGENTAIPCVLA